MTDEVKFEEAGEIYTVHEEPGYSSELIGIMMHISFIDTIKKAKFFIIGCCIILLLASSVLIFIYSGLFSHRILNSGPNIKAMSDSAPFQNKQ